MDPRIQLPPHVRFVFLRRLISFFILQSDPPMPSMLMLCQRRWWLRQQMAGSTARVAGMQGWRHSPLLTNGITKSSNPGSGGISELFIKTKSNSVRNCCLPEELCFERISRRRLPCHGLFRPAKNGPKRAVSHCDIGRKRTWGQTPIWNSAHCFAVSALHAGRDMFICRLSIR